MRLVDEMSDYISRDKAVERCGLPLRAPFKVIKYSASKINRLTR